MKNQKSKNTYNVIRWILLVPVVCFVDVVVAVLILSFIDFWGDIDIDLVCVCLTVVITLTSFFISKLIAPKYKKTTGIVCALIGFWCSAIFCYVLALAISMTH